MKEKVLQAMREFGAPVNAGKIAEITGIDRKEVDKAFAELKKEGAIVSPVRCKWQTLKRATPSRTSLPALPLRNCPTHGAAPAASVRKRNSYQ